MKVNTKLLLKNLNKAHIKYIWVSTGHLYIIFPPLNVEVIEKNFLKKVVQLVRGNTELL